MCDYDYDYENYDYDCDRDRDCVCVCLFRFHVFPMKHLWDQTPQAARSANFSAPASDAQAIAQLAKKLLDPGGSSHGMQMMFSKIHVAW